MIVEENGVLTLDRPDRLVMGAPVWAVRHRWLGQADAALYEHRLRKVGYEPRWDLDLYARAGLDAAVVRARFAFGARWWELMRALYRRGWVHVTSDEGTWPERWHFCLLRNGGPR